MKTNFDNYLSFISDLFEIIRKNRLYRRDHSSLPVRIKCQLTGLIEIGSQKEPYEV